MSPGRPSALCSANLTASRSLLGVVVARWRGQTLQERPYDPTALLSANPVSAPHSRTQLKGQFQIAGDHIYEPAAPQGKASRTLLDHILTGVARRVVDIRLGKCGIHRHRNSPLGNGQGDTSTLDTLMNSITIPSRLWYFID